MSSEWPKCRLEDVAASTSGAIAIGPFGSRLKSDAYTDSGVALIRGTNLSGSKFFSGDYVYVSEETAAGLGNANVKPNDLVFPHRGNIGSVGLVPDGDQAFAISSSLMKITLDVKRVDPLFMYYFFRTSIGQSELLKNASQVGTPGIATPLTSLRACQVPVPPLEAQREVSLFLGLIDDQIELLKDKNATLEAIAQAIFKSWFIDFDPVKAKSEGRVPDGIDETTAALFPDSFEESALGAIPKGWSVGGMGQICNNPRSQAKPESIDPKTPYIGLEHMPRKSIALDDAGTAEGLESGKFWFQRDDVLFGKLRPYFHKVGLAPCVGVCSTDILVLRANAPHMLGFAAMHLSSDRLIAYTTQLSNGARMPRTSWQHVESFDIAIPTTPLLAAFNDLVRPMFENIYANIEEARTLADLRDTLLPRLISGKLKLPESQEVAEAL